MKDISLDNSHLDMEIELGDDTTNEQTKDSPPPLSEISRMMETFNIKTFLYLSAFSILGVCSRVGLDQLFEGYVTTNGRSEQQGGALFSDLPANMVGSFVVGFITSISFVELQDHIMVGWKTGFCGSLTTFASWNSQMVVMMDGTINKQLGSQTGTAFFGYLIGIEIAIMSYRMGKQFATYLDHYIFILKESQTITDSNNNDETEEKKLNQPSESMNEGSGSKKKVKKYFYVVINTSPFILSLFLLIFFIVRDQKDLSMSKAESAQNSMEELRNLFFQKMWLCCLLAPFGTIFRWKLSALNNPQNKVIEPIIMALKLPSWIPYGTLFANILGSIFSIIAVGILDRLAIQGKVQSLQSIHNIQGQLLLSVLGALKTGFAGCLSTVSTFVTEIEKEVEKHPHVGRGYIYGFFSLFLACLLGLCVYIPLVRVL